MASAEPELEAAPASLKSAVWKYFAFPVSYVDSVRVVDKNTTECKMCYTRVPYPATGNTTNMAGHIRRHHKDVDLTGKTSSLVQPTIQSSFGVKLAQTSARAKAITNAIGLFIAADLQPYSVVENAGFKHLISVLEPRYSIPMGSLCLHGLVPNGSGCQSIPHTYTLSHSIDTLLHSMLSCSCPLWPPVQPGRLSTSFRLRPKPGLTQSDPTSPEQSRHSLQQMWVTVGEYGNPICF
ncbi:hypothetical protein MHYP_G00126920 [Metynnis hypsauchen]